VPLTDRYVAKQLGDREQILHVTRRHWIVLALGWLPELLIVAGIVALTTLALHYVSGKGWLAWGYALIVLPLVSMLADYIGWTTRKFIVTNRRVIQVSGVINKTVVDSSLEKVNDIQLLQRLLGRMLGYGDVEILTASELGLNRFTRLNQPLRFKTQLLNAKESFEAEFGRSS
jgi:uncharacterized membrane protein YdbT with pleckstrin-like domain